MPDGSGEAGFHAEVAIVWTSVAEMTGGGDGHGHGRRRTPRSSAGDEKLSPRGDVGHGGGMGDAELARPDRPYLTSLLGLRVCGGGRTDRCPRKNDSEAAPSTMLAMSRRIARTRLIRAQPGARASVPSSWPSSSPQTDATRIDPRHGKSSTCNQIATTMTCTREATPTA